MCEIVNATKEFVLENLPRTMQYDVVYMRIAKNVSELSYAVKAKVGCIIVSEDGQIISHGWNGTPHGSDNCCEYINEEGKLKTKPEVIHAESNALMKCARGGYRTENATAYVTLSPCIDCAKLLMQAGVKRVVYLEEYSKSAGVEFLNEHHVQVDKLAEI